MKIIKIKCFENGSTIKATEDFHFSGENFATKIEIDFSEITNKSYLKWVDLLMGDQSFARYNLGTDEIVSLSLSNENTVPGEMIIAPFITETLEPFSSKIKFQQKSELIKRQIDSGSAASTPKNDYIFLLKKKVEELDVAKLDKIVDLEGTEIDILTTLLLKADSENIQKLFKSATLDQSTGIMTFTAFDNTETIIDLPLELIVSSGSFDEITQEIVLILSSGDEIRIPVSGLITEVNRRLSALETKVANIENGTTKVPHAEFADKITTKEPKTVERILGIDITATNDVEILDNELTSKNAKIQKIESIEIDQAVEPTPEPILTTTTPIKYIEGKPSAVVDGVIVNSKPKQIISKSNNYFDCLWELGDISSLNGTNIVSSNAIRTPSYLSIKANTVYVMSPFTGQQRIWFYDIDKVFISTVGDSSFTTPSNAYFYRLRVNSTNLNYKFQLNEGTVALPYQPYAEHTINLPALPLEYGMPMLPNEVGDRWYSDRYEKRVGKVVLNGSESLSGDIRQENGFIRYYITVNINKINANIGISSPLNYISVSEATATTLFKEGVNCHETGLIRLIILQNRLKDYGYIDGDSKTYFTSIREWLQTNNLEVYYQLATPETITTTPYTANIPTYTNGTIIVDNNQGTIFLDKLYSKQCQSGIQYFVRCKLIDYTNAKITNGTHEILLTNGYAKFIANSDSEYYIDCNRDGINQISAVQWITIPSNLIDKAALELAMLFGLNLYPKGLTLTNPTKFVSSGNNWLNPKETYHRVAPSIGYKYIKDSVINGIVTSYLDINYNVINTTSDLNFITPNNCAYIEIQTQDENIALYLDTNPKTKFEEYVEDIVDLTTDDRYFVARNYGFECLDDIATITIEYQLDVTGSVKNTIEIVAKNERDLKILQEVVNSQYKIEIYSLADFSNVERQANVIYGVYDATKQITWYFGEVT